MRIGPMDGYVLMIQPETATPSNLGRKVLSIGNPPVFVRGAAEAVP
jgi:hypothetical protein